MFRILAMIEDSVERSTATEVLAACGYRVSTVECTTAAALEIDEYSTDLVLLDADLPGGRTDELLRTIKGSPSSSSVPVVVLGGRDSTAELLMACAFGAADFLMKPLNPEVFRSRIARVIQVAMADPQTWMGRAPVGVAA